MILSVNLAGDVAEALKRQCARQGISATEGVWRAIAVTRFVRRELAKGNTVAIVERGRCGSRRIREVEIIDL